MGPGGRAVGAAGQGADAAHFARWVAGSCAPRCERGGPHIPSDRPSLLPSLLPSRFPRPPSDNIASLLAETGLAPPTAAAIPDLLAGDAAAAHTDADEGGEEVQLDKRGVSAAQHLAMVREAPSLELPAFGLDVECSGGTYIRSLISDMARHETVTSCAHMSRLERTQQGPFGLHDCLHLPQWTFEAICAHTSQCTKVCQEAAPAPEVEEEEGGDVRA